MVPRDTIEAGASPVAAERSVALTHPTPQRQAAAAALVTTDIAAFADAIAAGGPLLGIDAGTKTLGLALSDTRCTIATGITTMRRAKFTADAREMLAFAERNAVAGIVVGLPLNLDGSEGPRAQGTRAFARNLARLTPLPILLFDERLSTAAAERALIEADMSRARRAEVIDKVAATIILQTALDALKARRAAPAGVQAAHAASTSTTQSE